MDSDKLLYYVLINKEWKNEYKKIDKISTYDRIIEYLQKIWFSRYKNNFFNTEKNLEDNELLDYWHMTPFWNGCFLLLLTSKKLEIRTCEKNDIPLLYSYHIFSSLNDSFFVKDKKFIDISSDNKFFAMVLSKNIVIFNLENILCHKIIGSIQILPHEVKYPLKILLSNQINSKNTMLLFDFNGFIYVYYQNNETAFEPIIRLDISNSFSKISDVCFCPKYEAILLGFEPNEKCCAKHTRCLYGLTTLKLSEDFEIAEVNPSVTCFKKAFFSRAIGMFGKSSIKIIKEIQLNDSNNKAAILYNNGTVSIFNYPSLTRFIELLSYSDNMNEKECEFESNNLYSLSWWSDKVLILMTINGHLYLFDIEKNKMILGDKPEIFSKNSIFSKVYLERFHIIEFTSKTHFKGVLLDDNWQRVVATFKGYTLNYILSYCKHMIKFYVDYIMNNNTMQRNLTRLKIINESVTLLTFKKVSPLELIDKKIINKEYGEALELAICYSISTDYIYKHQWMNSLKDKNSMEDYLIKIEDKLWVLKQCVLSKVNSLNDVEHLIKIGLKVTSLENVFGSSLISNNTNSLNFSYEEYLKLDNYKKKFCEFRVFLVGYLRRLKFYFKFCQNKDVRDEKLYVEEFCQMKNYLLIDFIAHYLSKTGDMSIIDFFIQHHSNLISYHIFALLSCLPEIIPVDNFRHIFEYFINKSLNPHSFSLSSDHDWTDNFEFLNLDQKINKLPQIYLEIPNIQQFNHQFSIELFSKWIIWRALYIERNFGLTSITMDILELGKHFKLLNIEPVYKNIKNVHFLNNVQNHKSMNYEKYCKLSFVEKFTLLFPVEINSEVWENSINDLLVPFIEDSKDQWHNIPFALINIYKQFGFKSIFPFLDNSYMNKWKVINTEWIIISIFEYLKSSNKETLDLTEYMFLERILNDFIKNSSINLSNSVITAKQILNIIKILINFSFLNYSISSSNSYECMINQSILLSILEKSTYSFIKMINSPSSNDKLIKVIFQSNNNSSNFYVAALTFLIRNIFSLQQYISSKFEDPTIFKIIINKLFLSNNIQIIESVVGNYFNFNNFIQSHDKKLIEWRPIAECSFDIQLSLDILLHNVRANLMISNRFNDQPMRLAKFLMEIHEKIDKSSADFINFKDSLKCCEYLSSIKVDLSPSTVIFSKDKLLLFKRILNELDELDSKIPLLIHLGKCLPLLKKPTTLSESWEKMAKFEMDIENNVLLLIGNLYLDQSLINKSFGICLQLIQRNYSNAWLLSSNLCRYNSSILSNQQKLNLVSFSLRNCPCSSINDLLMLHQKLMLETDRLIIDDNYADNMIMPSLIGNLNGSKKSFPNGSWFLFSLKLNQSSLSIDSEIMRTIQCLTDSNELYDYGFLVEMIQMIESFGCINEIIKIQVRNTNFYWLFVLKMAINERISAEFHMKSIPLLPKSSMDSFEFDQLKEHFSTEFCGFYKMLTDKIELIVTTFQKFKDCLDFNMERFIIDPDYRLTYFLDQIVNNLQNPQLSLIGRINDFTVFNLQPLFLLTSILNYLIKNQEFIKLNLLIELFLKSDTIDYLIEMNQSNSNKILMLLKEYLTFLDGGQFSLLIGYFSLVNSLAVDKSLPIVYIDNVSFTPQQHINLLKKLKAFFADIDYSLLNNLNHYMNLIYEHVSETNSNSFIRIFKDFRLGEVKLDQSCICASLIGRIIINFFNKDPSSDFLLFSSRFDEELFPRMNKLLMQIINMDNFVWFLRKISFDHSVILEISIEKRMFIIEKSLAILETSEQQIRIENPTKICNKFLELLKKLQSVEKFALEVNFQFMPFYKKIEASLLDSHFQIENVIIEIAFDDKLPKKHSVEFINLLGNQVDIKSRLFSKLFIQKILEIEKDDQYRTLHDFLNAFKQINNKYYDNLLEIIHEFLLELVNYIKQNQFYFIPRQYENIQKCFLILNENDSYSLLIDSDDFLLFKCYICVFLSNKLNFINENTDESSLISQLKGFYQSNLSKNEWFHLLKQQIESENYNLQFMVDILINSKDLNCLLLVQSSILYQQLFNRLFLSTSSTNYDLLLKLYLCFNDVHPLKNHVLWNYVCEIWMNQNEDISFCLVIHSKDNDIIERFIQQFFKNINEIQIKKLENSVDCLRILIDTKFITSIYGLNKSLSMRLVKSIRKYLPKDYDNVQKLFESEALNFSFNEIHETTSTNFISKKLSSFFSFN